MVIQLHVASDERPHGEVRYWILQAGAEARPVLHQADLILVGLDTVQITQWILDFLGYAERDVLAGPQGSSVGHIDRAADR